MKTTMSIEELGARHVAAVAPEGVEPCLIDAARSYVRLEDVEGLFFGRTFAETLAMNASRLDVVIV